MTRATTVLKIGYNQYVVALLVDDLAKFDAIKVDGNTGLVSDYSEMRVYRSESAARSAARRVFGYSSFADTSNGSFKSVISFEAARKTA